MNGEIKSLEEKFESSQEENLELRKQQMSNKQQLKDDNAQVYAQLTE